MEPLIIQRYDLVVANSPWLRDRALKTNQHSYYVGQGCDLDVFNLAATRTIAPDLLAIKANGWPTIGYLGALFSLRLDLDLLYAMAKAKPKYNFVFIGGEDEDFKKSPLHGLNNVHFLGSKPVSTLPGYIAGIDVCLNPQIINQVTIGNYPRKVDEYLAMGKPVVATKTEFMEEFSHVCYLGNTIEDYLKNIDLALSENTPDLAQIRSDFAHTHSWEANAKRIKTAIMEAGFEQLIS